MGKFTIHIGEQSVLHKTIKGAAANCGVGLRLGEESGKLDISC
jgi:hypothetical protein